MKVKPTNRKLAVAMAIYLAQKKINIKKLAPVIGIAASTLYKRRADPGLTRLTELRRMADLFGLTNEEIGEIVRDSL